MKTKEEFRLRLREIETKERFAAAMEQAADDLAEARRILHLAFPHLASAHGRDETLGRGMI